MNTRNLIAVSFLIIALSIAYYFVIYLPQKDAKRTDELKDQESAAAATKQQLGYCLEGAKESYTYNWSKACKTRGLKDECSLPSDTADSVNQYLKDAKDECFKKYPQ